MGDGTSLAPMASVWADPSVSEGKADWQPFRAPVFEAENAGQREAVVGGGGRIPAARAAEIETDLRDLIDEYNSLLDQEKYDDLTDFYVEGQSEIVELMVGSLPKISGKLEELAAVVPRDDAPMKSLLDAMSLRRVLRLEIADLRVISDEEAVATTPRSSADSDSEAAPGGFGFVFTDGYWYFDNPALTAMREMLSGHAQHIATIDQLIKDIQSGKTPANSLAGRMATIATMLEPLPRSSTRRNPADVTDGAANKERSGTADEGSGGEATGD